MNELEHTLIMNELNKPKLTLKYLHATIRSSLDYISRQRISKELKQGTIYHFRVATKAFKLIQTKTDNYPLFYEKDLNSISNRIVDYLKKHIVDYSTIVNLFEFYNIYISYTNLETVKLFAEIAQDKPFPNLNIYVLSIAHKYHVTLDDRVRLPIAIKSLDLSLPNTGKYTVLTQLYNYYRNKPNDRESENDPVTEELIQEQTYILQATKELYNDTIQRS